MGDLGLILVHCLWKSSSTGSPLNSLQCQRLESNQSIAHFQCADFTGCLLWQIQDSIAYALRLPIARPHPLVGRVGFEPTLEGIFNLAKLLLESLGCQTGLEPAVTRATTQCISTYASSTVSPERFELSLYSLEDCCLSFGLRRVTSAPGGTRTHDSRIKSALPQPLGHWSKL